MSDLISRQAAISHVDDVPYIKDHPNVGLLWKAWIGSLPPAQPERKKGKWILIKGSNGKDYHKCSECFHEQEITGVKNFCAVCGADMQGVNENEYID